MRSNSRFCGVDHGFAPAGQGPEGCFRLARPPVAGSKTALPGSRTGPSSTAGVVGPGRGPGVP